MKTTGVIRRIDDLGRIVIPKEIRKNLRIKNGDSLEIMVDEENLILKKYSAIESMETIATKYADAIQKTIKHNVIVTDRDKVIAASGSLKTKYIDKTITEFVERSIERRDSFVERQKKTMNFVDDVDEFCVYSFSSIISNSDCIGGVIIICTEGQLLEYEEKMAVVLANLLSKYFVE
ncbi:MAG: stage V sporulation T C-terminal domain-containing protein [bacterium]|nr:stage V sporulation T C-terminal domain-containing protein [bacterium]